MVITFKHMFGTTNHNRLGQETLEVGMGSLIWSQDGLSHTIIVGDAKFLAKMSEFLNTESC